MTSSIASLLRRTPVVGSCFSGLESAGSALKGTLSAGIQQIIPGAGLLFAGGGLMASSSQMLAHGHFSEAATHAAVAVSSIEMGANLSDFSQNKDELITIGVTTSALTVAFEGLKDVYQSARKGCREKLLGGAARLAGGALVLASALKAGVQSTSFVTQTLAIGSLFAKVAYLGAMDIRKGNYLSGLGKMALGAGGVAASGYAIYQEFVPQTREIRLATVYWNNCNEQRQQISDATTENHKKYADYHNLKHDVVTESLVKGQCKNPITKKTADCSPYWNKIKYFNNWCEEPQKPGTEEWAIYADDDAVYTNFQVDPSDAIDRLRGSRDTGFIIATGGEGTRCNPGAVNTGVMIVRKDPKGCGVINKIWANRNAVTDLSNPDCPTYGLCKGQINGDEQGATDKVFWRDDPMMAGRDATRVLARDATHPSRGDIAFNTVNRNGCFTAVRADGSLTGPYDISTHDLAVNPDGIWREGDWIGQTAGYPLYGQDLSHQPRDKCTDDPSIPREPIRYKKVQKMIAAADKTLWVDPRVHTPKIESTSPNPAFEFRRQALNRPSGAEFIGPVNREITFGAAYDNGGDPNRQPISDFVNENHAQYSRRWAMKHVVVSEDLVAGKCTHPATGASANCAPYWNKIEMLRTWLHEPSKPGVEEWRYYADDDMLVMNMSKDPSIAIDQLRSGQDTSVIVAEDVIDWQRWFFEESNPRLAVNTGAIIVRKDARAREFIDAIWALRNAPVEKPTTTCPTIGMCPIQAKSLHEQQAMTMLLRQDPDLLGDYITVVRPRDTASETRGDLAMNTFYRNGCFTRAQKGTKAATFTYDPMDSAENPSGAFQKGDWLTQVAGVPVWGKDLPLTDGNCADREDIPEGPVRLNKLKELATHIVE